MTGVVITGVGAVSAFGVGIAALWDGLGAGRSAIGPIQSFDASTFPVRIAGEVGVKTIERAWLRAYLGDLGAGEKVWDRYAAAGALRDRKTVFGVLAALQAWRMADCGRPEREAGMVIALGLEQAFLEDFAPIFQHQNIVWALDKTAITPAIRYRSEVDLCAKLIGDLLALEQPSVVNASACAAGGLSIAQAASLIERGAASIMLCGGADSMVNAFGLGGMHRLGAPP